MAKRIEAGKFLVIECTARELMDAVGTDACLCDWCCRRCNPRETGYYIAVLNHWYCGECYRSWKKSARWYPDDADIERKNFEFYARRLGLTV